MAFTPTLLPLPVLPPMSRWGILSRSATTGRPAMSLPSARCSRPRASSGTVAEGRAVHDLPEGDDLALAVGHLDAHQVLAGDAVHAHGLGLQGQGQVLLHAQDAWRAGCRRPAGTRRP